MNDHIQQLAVIQQALTAAAAVSMLNNLLNGNPLQQAASNLATNANALTESQTNEIQQQHQPDSRQSPATTSSPANQIENLAKLQDFLLQLQQQANAGGANQAGQQSATAGAALGASGAPFNINSPSHQLLAHSKNAAGSPLSQSPLGAARHLDLSTNSNIQKSNQSPSNKKLKRHHQPGQQQFSQLQNNRPILEATSKSDHHLTPKSHTSISNLAGRNGNSSTNSSSSSAFIPNNVGLPRKLVRGQDVWLGRGAEQTRQILKCMWCGQSFRTLAEMSQHMKVTQHYTNIISQEQLTSWRQPEHSEANVNKGANKQSNQVKNFEESQDFASEKFNDSDREDSFSNGEDSNPRQSRSKSTQNRIPDNRLANKQAPSTFSTTDQEDLSPNTSPKQSSALKPLTRSRKRDHSEIKSPSSTKSTNRDTIGQANSPASSSSSLHRDSEALNDLDEISNASRESEAQNARSPETKPEPELESTDSNDGMSSTKNFTADSEDYKQEQSNGRSTSTTIQETKTTPKKESNLNQDEIEGGGGGVERNDDSASDDGKGRSDSEASNDERNEEKQGNSDKCSKKRSKLKEEAEIIAAGGVIGQKGEDSGDPLSALETMVEKSFDPRMRPGISNGGILQRLGIDEEVCPPWQHINYANWYAAAAYGHPMAAALLAAGINLQNGIKLSKNDTAKKSED